MRLTNKKTLYYLCLLMALLIIANCNGNGGGGTTGPSPNAPVQTNFQIRALTPEVTPGTVRYLGQFTATDPNNDIVGGQAEIRIVATGQVLSFTITEAARVSGDTFGGVLTLTNLPLGRTDLVHTVIDAAGNRSNGIPFFITIAAAELHRGAVPARPEADWAPRR
jgi:hypothetical protein